MSEQIREQVSAFLDGELPGSETELLLKRLTRDSELRDAFGRYALIGEAMRGSKHTLLKKGFESRVNLAIDGEPVHTVPQISPLRTARWWRPIAGAAVVAGVAAVAIVAMQQRSLLAPGAVTATASSAAAPGVPTQPGATGQAVLAANQEASSHEAVSYTVPPAAPAEVPVALHSGRLTNYMFAHSKYSYGLGQRGVLTDLLIEDDDSANAARQTVKQVPVRVVQ